MSEHEVYPELTLAIRHSIQKYFDDLEGEMPSAVYAMFLARVEPTLLACILERVEGNQSKAAAILGVNRNTLRKKLKQYELLR
jgi:Fis family transcriptional regulator